MSQGYETGSDLSTVLGDNIPERVEDIPVLTQPARNQLTERQAVDYAGHRASLLRWSLNLGKNPEKGEGYAYYTIRDRAYRLDRFYRWVWCEYDGYTTAVTHDHADAFMKELAYGDTSKDDKAQHYKGLKMLFRWRKWELGEDEWDPEITFSGDSRTDHPRDFFSVEERQQVREAALEYGAVPSYKGLTPDERDSWKAHLSQRFEKPKDDVGPDDFERANSWKAASMVWTSLDAGLRPVEVERASTRWVDVKNRVLRIPKEESSKGEENWIVSLTDRTASALDRWLVERQQYEKYEGTDALWLTRNGTPYKSYSLNYLLRNLCEEAGIPTENRQVSWYSIRHSVGTYMSREEGLAAAQSQLRHKSEQTTMRYDQAPVEDRRDALNKMG